MPGTPIDRREFVATATRAAVGAAVATGPVLRAAGQDPTDTVSLGIIGFGVQGLADANAARRLPNVRVVAAASCYDGHLERARELLGDDSLRTRDYRAILDRKDVDAVVVATPDHWHARICLDALAAGKDVYCEKPMTHTVEEGEALLKAVASSTHLLQVGSQHTSSPHIVEAKQLIADGLLGQVTQVKASWDTNNEVSAWVAPIPPDASPATIDWDRFQGSAPKHPFDARRVFRWRTYRDYGEGLSGDVLVHMLTAVHYVLGLGAPTIGTAVGGRLVWKDERDVYDTIMGGWEYPEGVVVTMGASQNNGFDGTQIRLMGTKATMVLTWNDYVVYEEDSPPNWRYTTNVWPKALREAYWASKGLPIEAPPPTPQVRRDPKVLKRWDPPALAPGAPRVPWHMQHFVDCVRARRRPVQDVAMGNDAAVAAHMANLAYYGKQAVHFDRATRRIVARPGPGA